MRFIFDLDGVMRCLSAIPRNGVIPQSWNEPCPDGQGLIEYVDSNPEVLRLAPPLPYLSVIKKLDHITVVSCQPRGWRHNTDLWLLKHLGDKRYSYYFVDTPEEELKWLEVDGVYLVEDYPKFPRSAYSKIILIDWPYNRKIDCFARVKTPEELAWILRV